MFSGNDTVHSGPRYTDLEAKNFALQRERKTKTWQLRTRINVHRAPSTEVILNPLRPDIQPTALRFCGTDVVG